jgi:catechol 2,3-dioxygenase-like lactoylglutathione lyase family enzyme
MVRQIAPLFFTMNIPATLAYYKEKLGFECLGTWQDPPVYAIVARDQQVIHFRCAEPPKANPNQYRDEPGRTARRVPVRRRCRCTLYRVRSPRRRIHSGVANMPWHSREFVVKDCDGRLLAFGANL